MKGKKSPPSGPAKLDRFGTHRAFTDNTLAAIVKGPKGSMAAGLAWFVFWDKANGKTAIVRGMSVSRLAKLTGTRRETARKAIDTLLDLGAIVIVKGTEGDQVPVYFVPHTLHGTSQTDE